MTFIFYTTEYPTIKSQNSEGKLSTVVKFLIGPILAVAILVAPFAVVIIDKDPFYFIFEEILEDPKYRGFWTIVGAFGIRFAIIFSSNAEGFRSGAYLYTVGLIALDRFVQIITVPIVKFKSARKILKFHIQYRLLVNAIQPVLQSLLFILLTFFFWTTVMLFWVSVKCSPGQIGYLLYYWYAISFGLLLVGASFIGAIACEIIDLDGDAVKLNILMAKRELVQSRSRESKITLKRAKAVRPLQIKYGSFGYIGSGFWIDYVCVLFDRCVDAILMFDYN